MDSEQDMTSGEWGPLTNTVLPIEIRPGYRVWIQGLPHDLTKCEAEKVSAVIIAMATPANPLDKS